jgi:hypothetical protein
MNNFKQLLLKEIEFRKVKFPIYRRHKILGCTNDEIIGLMKDQNVDYLPQIYKDFLLTMGQNQGHWFVGSRINIKRIRGLKKEFITKKKQDNLWDDKLSDIFVFMNHQGYVDYFFHTASQEPDPIVFVSIEGEISECQFPLSEFLLQRKRC